MNYNLLKAKCYEKGMTLGSMADKAGINAANLVRMKTGGNITVLTAQKIAEVLELSRDEITAIFFANNVA